MVLVGWFVFVFFLLAKWSSSLHTLHGASEIIGLSNYLSINLQHCFFPHTCFSLFSRLKQMLNDLVRQQEEQQYEEKSSRKERGNSAPPPPSPVFCPFSFPPQPVNLFNVPGFTNFSSFAPGKYYYRCEK